MSRAAHVARVRNIYRQALRTSLDWYMSRETWRPEALRIREEFEKNRHITNLREAEKLCEEAERQLIKFAHPNPYKYPLAPEGSKWERAPYPTVSNNVVWKDTHKAYTLI
jgi:NADH dehydrogenase (ubiquinone) 1 beta subcomplex subunit 9